MSKARLVITAIEVEGRTPAEVVAAYGVSRSWLFELLARYRAEATPGSSDAPGARTPSRGHPSAHRRAGPADPQAVERVRAGRRRAHHRLAPDPSSPDHPVACHDPPDPGPARHRRSRPGQAAAVLLPLLRRRVAQRDLAVRLHPLPAHPPDRRTSSRWTSLQVSGISPNGAGPAACSAAASPASRAWDSIANSAERRHGSQLAPWPGHQRGPQRRAAPGPALGQTGLHLPSGSGRASPGPPRFTPPAFPAPRSAARSRITSCVRWPNVRPSFVRTPCGGISGSMMSHGPSRTRPSRCPRPDDSGRPTSHPHEASS
jgi:hypothetical protein